MPENHIRHQLLSLQAADLTNSYSLISEVQKDNPAGGTAVLQTSTSNQDCEMKHLSTAEIAVIKARILRGDRYSEIASDYRINQGRLADLKFGRIYASVEPADLSHRPTR
ncbi:hypothetical protein [Bradyrhizobium forestalis]|uniref:hypothetical protein n=1 Tax=Bradyrhizobium forestalis TaxID=1419263 RepID=UPI0011AF9183|nr:hypothetical protein [Bradyrhizobium forestalis]